MIKFSNEILKRSVNISKLTVKENATIEKELSAYLKNFKKISIEKVGKMYYVYEDGNDSYVFNCSNINVLKGWLYGAIQAKNKIITKL